MTQIRSLMNNPESEDYKETMKNHVEEQEVTYNDVVDISDEFQKSQTFKNLIKQKLIEVVEEDE